MEWIAQITFADIVLSFLTCSLIRETMVIVLPDSIVGPGGWLLDTGHED